MLSNAQVDVSEERSSASSDKSLVGFSHSIYATSGRRVRFRLATFALAASNRAFF